MAIAALARPWQGIQKQDFVVKTTQKEKCAPFCVLIDIVSQHKQQRTLLLRSIEGSAIASQSISLREAQANRKTALKHIWVLAQSDLAQW